MNSRARIISYFFKEKNFFRFPKVLLRALGDRETILLSFLLNHEDRFGEWFYCEAKVIEKELGYSVRQQTESFVKLKTWNLIQTRKTKTIPAKREIWINYTELEKQLGLNSSPDRTSSGLSGQDKFGAVYYKENEYKKRKTKIVMKSPEAPSHNNRLIGFISKHQKFDDNISQLLKATITKSERIQHHPKNKIHLKCNPFRKWSLAIALLRKKYSQQEISIEAEWFASNSEDEFTPIIYTAQMFGSKFLPIREARLRKQNGKFIKKNQPQKIKPSAEVQTKIVDRLKALYQWPKDSDKQLGSACQLSFNNYKRFRSSCSNLSQNNTLDFVTGYWTNDFDFILDWFEWVNTQIHSWDAWSGDLGMFVFRYDHKHFVKMCHTLANEYGGKWDPILELLRGK